MPKDNKQLLILDLDETIIYSTDGALERPPDFMAGKYHVYKRPYVGEFLSAYARWFELAVWSTSSEVYSEAIIQKLFTGIYLSFVWARQRCTAAVDPGTGRQFWIKDLKKLKRKGYRLERIIVVDDSQEKLQRNYGNLVRVEPFLGDQGDTELKQLLPFLDQLRTVDDVRRIDKRSWRLS